MSDSIAINPIAPFDTKIRPPGSKSLTNRALLVAALAKGESVLHGILIADDTKQMLRALEALGFTVVLDEKNHRASITGHGGQIPSDPGIHETKLHLGNAGTAYRFLTAACCLGAQGEPQVPAHVAGASRSYIYQLDGIERMQHRPIGQLVDALRKLGGQIDYLGQSGYPPLRICGTGLKGGSVMMPPTLSSQYISALLQVGPYCENGLAITFDGPITSRPYVQMTVGLMAHFGIDAQVDPGFTQIRVKPGCYRATTYHIEPDASNASYFLAAAAIIPGSQCTIEGLGRGSLQGDVGFADVLHQMGAGLLFGQDFITVIAPPAGQRLGGISVDLNHMPDMAQTLAAVALFAEGKTQIHNIGNLRVKETDRMVALQHELTKLGANVEIHGDTMTITPPPDHRVTIPPGTTIDTYDDHRMAMSFAIVGLKTPGLIINDPTCVNKTFPDFFEYLARLGNAG